MTPDDPAYGPDGLVPVVVQHADTAQVLMVAYANRAAVAATLDTGQVHFWSRSRGELWRKGATSGNTLAFVGARLDCDGDAMLVTARPAGPACHTGDATCFGNEEQEGFAALEELWAVIASRAAERPRGSYTVELLDGGVDAVARKVIEEAGEVVLAAKDGERVADEAADLVYHLLVLLAQQGLGPRELLAALARRR